MAVGIRIVLREGRLQTAAALVVALAIVGVIAVPSWTESQTAGRMAIFGFGLFAFALAVGSARLVGVATLPIFAAALIVSAGADDPVWVRSIVLGVLWYLAAELAWEGIERRDGATRSSAFNDRRIDEATTVLVLTLAITTAAFLTSFLTPVRTVLAVGLIIVGLITALNLANRHLRLGGHDQGVAQGDPMRHANDARG